MSSPTGCDAYPPRRTSNGNALTPVSADILSHPLPPTDWIEDLIRESWLSHKQSQESIHRLQTVISKLSGLVGSLKSIILHMDPERGRAMLKGEIAAMEQVLFGPMVSATPKKKKKKPNKSKMASSPSSQSGHEMSYDEPDLMALEDYGAMEEEEMDVGPPPSTPSRQGPTRIVMTPQSEGSILDAMLDTTAGSVSTLGSDEFPGQTEPGSVTKPQQRSRQREQPSPHPRVTNAVYWKEFSTQSRSQIEQAVRLEASMKKRDGWSLSTTLQSMFS